MPSPTSAAFQALSPALFTFNRRLSPTPRRPTPARRVTGPTAVLRPNDTVAVVGATGGVGRNLIALLLADGRYRVRAVARSPSRAASFFPSDNPNLTIVAADVSAVPADPRLETALAGAAAIVIATGTTAFPTRAWGKFPSFSNSPDRVDRIGSESILSSLDASALKRIVLLTSIGTLRPSRFPYSILNLFGVLKAKRAAEENVARTTQESCGTYSYAVVRPGRLVGGPHTNPGENQKGEPGQEELAVLAAAGDVLAGEISRNGVARVILKTLEWPREENVEFCCVNQQGPAPSRDLWHSTLDSFVDVKNDSKF
jgi:nucleoside-diphosphate-sugar epimerase